MHWFYFKIVDGTFISTVVLLFMKFEIVYLCL